MTRSRAPGLPFWQSTEPLGSDTGPLLATGLDGERTERAAPPLSGPGGGLSERATWKLAGHVEIAGHMETSRLHGD